MTPKPRPLTDEEKAGIVLAVQATFTTLRDLYEQVQPIFESHGFPAPSIGVVARELPEKVERAIAQHCASFTKNQPHAGLQRDGADWKVKVCKDAGLTLPPSRIVSGEHYIVVNYRANTQVVKVWVLWNAQDHFFSARPRGSSGARALIETLALPSIQVLQAAPPSGTRIGSAKPAPMAKATLRIHRRARAMGT